MPQEPIAYDAHAVFVIVVLLIGIGIVARWFASYFGNRLDSQFSELLREISEVKNDVQNDFKLLHGVMEDLIKRLQQVDKHTASIDSSLETLLNFIDRKKTGK